MTENERELCPICGAIMDGVDKENPCYAYCPKCDELMAMIKDCVLDIERHGVVAVVDELYNLVIADRKEREASGCLSCIHKEDCSCFDCEAEIRRDERVAVAKACIETIKSFDMPGKFIPGVVPVGYVVEAIEKQFITTNSPTDVAPKEGEK